MKNSVFELCVESVDAARAGEIGGANRIELCSHLECGGITPEPELIAAVLEAVTIPVHILIRSRAGNFNFSAEEFKQMQRQIDQAGQLGACGVAVGVLCADGRVDVERSRELVRQSRPMRATFHRAFDETPDLSEALEAVIQTGADCLLTSGGAADVLAGAEPIAQLYRQAGNRLNIMAAGGLRLSNLIRLVRQTGVSNIHGSLTERPPHAAGDQRDFAAMLEDDVREAVRLLRDEMKRRSGSEAAFSTAEKG